jgi:exonuclease III
MKIISYNLRFGGKGRVHWREVIDRYSPSVLLVQESYPPSEHLPEDDKVESNAVWASAVNSNKSMKWGSGIYLPDCPPTPIEIPDFHGWVVGAEVENWPHSPAKSKKTRFFSIHAPGHKGSYQKAVNAILDLLLEYRDGCELVIGGDFNLSVSERQEDEEKTTSNADRKIQNRLRDEFGLVNCWQTANPDQPLPQTLRWVSKPEVPYHCDGIFVPKEWVAALKSSEVISGELWDGLSDHNPVMVEFFHL